MSSVLKDSEAAGSGASRAIDAVLRSGASVSVLVSGFEGGGQRDVAERLAKGHICSGGPSRPCGECRTCGAFDRGNSPDLLRIEPSGKSDWIALAAIVFRERSKIEHPPVHDFLRVPPMTSLLKVVLIHEAERLGIDAGNALLKIIEEPPDFARFVLSTSNLSRILPTIRSRCLLIGCDLPPRSHSDELEALSGGAPETVRTLSAPPFSEFVDEFANWVRGLSAARKSEALRFSGEFQTFASRYKDLALQEETAAKGERAVRAEFLSLFANAIGHEIRTGQIQYARLGSFIVEAHGAVQGNVRFDFVCDAMFANAFGSG